MSGVVLNPVAANLGDGTQQLNNVYGKQGEQLKADLHGKWYNANARKSVFSFTVANVTVPTIASGLVSVFTLYNPPSSGVSAEIITTEMGLETATEVVNTMGWYFSTAALTALGTFTTPAVALTNYFSGRVGDTPNGGVKPYTAYTHSGTPVRIDMAATITATAVTAVVYPVKAHDGGLILPPGIAMSFATSTGAYAGVDITVRWAEWPFA